jgi:hypothetical protein
LVTLTPAPSVLEFLIDSSGSMNDLPMGAPVSKWRVTVDALSETFRDMQGGTGVGLSFFPNTKAAPAAGACIVKEQAVPIGVLDATLLDSLLRALNAKLPAGTTPTHDAYSFALETLRASQLAGEKAVVLATDGAPNYALGCMGDGMASVDSAPLIAEAANALRADGIRTFVIGSPGSEPAREVLSKIAFEGGTGSAGCSVQGPAYCHFDMTTAPDLSAALNATLQTIAGASKSCRYGLPTPQVGSLDLNLVNLLLEDSAGASILLTTEPAGAGECHAGWRYTVDSKEIELCPDICARVNADPGARVAASLGCKGISR